MQTSLTSQAKCLDDASFHQRHISSHSKETSTSYHLPRIDMMSSQVGKLVTVGSTHGPPTDSEISSRAQALCQFLQDLPPGSALPDVHIASLRIVLAHLDGDEALTTLTTSTRGTSLLLLFAQTWALAARIGLPIVQNKLISTMEDIYDASLDNRTVYPADANLLKAFDSLVQEVGKNSHAEVFLICFVARTTPITSELEKQLGAHDFATDIRGSILAEARSFGHDPIKHMPRRFRVDTSHPPSYRPLEARSAFVPVFVSKHTPMPAMHDKQSHSRFLTADSQSLSCHNSFMSPTMSPPPTYDNLFDYSAIMSQIKDVPPSREDSAFRWASAVGSNSMLPTVATSPDLIVMPLAAQNVPSNPPNMGIGDPAATAAQNRGLGLSNGVPTPAPNAAPAMAPSVPTPDPGLPRMPEVAQAAQSNPRDFTATDAGPVRNVSAPMPPTSPPLVPAPSPAVHPGDIAPAAIPAVQPVNVGPAPTPVVQPVNAGPVMSPAVQPVGVAPVRQSVGPIDGSEIGAQPPRVAAPIAPTLPSPAPEPIPAVQPVDAVPHRQSGGSTDASEAGPRPHRRSEAVPAPGTDTRAPHPILHCCNFRPAKQRTWVSRILHGWRCPGTPCPQHECAHHPPAITQTPRCAGPTSCRHDHCHCKLPAEGIIINTRSHHGRSSHHDQDGHEDGDAGTPPPPPRSTEPRRRHRHSSHADTIALRTPEHDIRVPRRTRRSHGDARGSRRHTAHSSSDETVAWWRPKKTGERKKFHLVSYSRHRWDE